MQLFYLENPNDKIFLSKEESKHVIKVLRKQVGDILNFTDGKGKLYKAEINNIDKNKCELNLQAKEEKNKHHNYHLHIAIAPTKNTDRFEWFLEKATEIGIDEITPIICENSERKVVKIDRCNRILLSAMKQSLKFHLPIINKTTSLTDFISRDFTANKLIAHCKEREKEELINVKKGKNTIILIGPEGDFSNNEIDLALKNDFKSVSLGSNRLRTETAGVVAVHNIYITQKLRK